MENLRPKTSSHRDFCVRGRFRETTREMLEAHVVIFGVKVRFVQVQQRDENYEQSTAFFHVGTFLQHVNAMMSPSNWTTNISGKEWVYCAAGLQAEVLNLSSRCKTECVEIYIRIFSKYFTKKRCGFCFFRLCHINSIYSKSASVKHFVAGSDVTALTETWDRPQFSDNLFADLRSYNVFRKQGEKVFMEVWL